VRPRPAQAVLLLGIACAPPPAEPTLALTHVAVVDVRAGTTKSDQTVVIRGRRIVSAGDASTTSVPSGARLIDGAGKYLIPGLWDMHVHLDSADLPALVALGITGARDMGGDLEELLAWRGRIVAGDLTGPRLVIAGPALRGPRSPSDSGPWVIRMPWQGIAAVDSLAARHVDFIKIHEGIFDDAYRAIAVQAKLRHLPFVGHVPTGVGVGWLCPTIGSFRVFAPKQFPAIFAGFKELVPLLRAHGIELLAGTDLGTTGIVPGASLHDELALLVDAGYTPAEALRFATLNPARFLGLSDSLGSVEVGKIADLVALERDPLADIRNTRSIAVVIQAGTVLPSP